MMMCADLQLHVVDLRSIVFQFASPFVAGTELDKIGHSFEHTVFKLAHDFFISTRGFGPPSQPR